MNRVAATGIALVVVVLGSSVGVVLAAGVGLMVRAFRLAAGVD